MALLWAMKKSALEHKTLYRVRRIDPYPPIEEQDGNKPLFNT